MPLRLQRVDCIARPLDVPSTRCIPKSNGSPVRLGVSLAGYPPTCPPSLVRRRRPWRRRVLLDGLFEHPAWQLDEITPIRSAELLRSGK